MKCLLIFLSLTVISRASVLQYSLDVQAPQLLSVKSLNPLGLEVVWKPVPSWSFNPVMGYKVNIWKQQKKLEFQYELVDGVHQWVAKEVLAPVSLRNGGRRDEDAWHLLTEKFHNSLPYGVPDWTPEEVFVQGATATAGQYHGIERGVWYDIRVQAVALRGEGPLSNFARAMF